MHSQSGLLLLLSFLFCFVSISLQASISLGSGFSTDDDGLGFLATYKNSKFAITCTCIREVDANGNVVRDSFMQTGVKQNITTLNDMADFKHWTMGLGVLQPSGASYLWDIKLAKQDTTIASVPGSSLQVAVPEGGLKTNILVNWPVALASTNKFQICQHVSWSINADDLGEGSLVPNTYIKNSAGSIIGVQIHGNFKFSFSMPGQFLLQNSGQSTNSSSVPGSLKDYSVAVTGEKYSLSGSVELVLTTETIGEQMQFDPLVTFNASFAACLKPLSIAVVLLAALALAWLA